jgi:hypothetical protein
MIYEDDIGNVWVFETPNCTSNLIRVKFYWGEEVEF